MGEKHKLLVMFLANHAKLLRKMDRASEAKLAEARAKSISNSFAAANGIGHVIDLETLLIEGKR